MTIKTMKIILGLGILLFTLGCVNSSANTNTNEVVNTPVNTVPSPQTPPVENTATIFTLSDVAAHAQPSDCWTAINGKVYDLTDFVNGHPGGPAILQACGIDGTTLFETRNGKGPHPSEVINTLEQYYIGELSQ